MLNKPESCNGCPLYSGPCGKKIGFSVPTGTGKNGVFICGEALGEQEEKEGMALVGKSGYSLFQQLKRINIEREDFTIHNVLSCRPPDNKLVGLPWAQDAIDHCAPNLDKAIEEAREIAKQNNKTFVIVTLGTTAFRRVLGLDSRRDAGLLKLDYYGYPFRSDKYDCWVYNCPHPAYLLRGQTHLWPVIQFVFSRAIEVANNGLRLDNSEYLLDPSLDDFNRYIDGYQRSLGIIQDNPLSYDIETPYKKKTGDEDEVGKEDYGDHTILRIGFSYRHNGNYYTCSVAWSAEFLAGIERLFAIAPFVLGWNSDKYDYPRVVRHVPIKGIGLDGMIAWHILNSSLPKALGFVTPYYWQATDMWKHKADSEPAFYNAKDSEAALRNWFGIRDDLIRHKLWHVYERHWIELSKALKYMTGIGVLRDNVMRDDAEKSLSKMLDDVEHRMEEAIPNDAREIKIYKKAPKEIKAGMYEGTKDFPEKFCKDCGISLKRKWKQHASLCGGSEVVEFPVPSSVWMEPLEFKLSKKRLLSYQKVLKHQAILSRKERKITFDADAIAMLVKQYPTDKLYPTILEHRKIGKILNTYIGVTEDGKLHGGMPIGPDGRIHTVYGRDASTLRFTSEDPNLQNLNRPNPKDPNDIANIVRNLVVATPGSILYARDFSGIEAVLTGYFAMDARYIRIAKRDVHTFYTVHAVYELEGGRRIQAADLPDINWSDDRLFPYLEQLKKEFKTDRNNLYKHLVHAANFMQGAKGAADKIFSETGVQYPVATVKKVMDVYYNLFPKIRQWHWNVLDEAEKDGYLRNPFGYVHRFNRPYNYKKEFGEWVRKPGEDANAAIAFKPQSTAVGIITEAILRLYFNRFSEAGRYLRLQVHDELLFEIPRPDWEGVDVVVKEEMEAPIPQMPLPISWGMGQYLNVLTEAKADFNEPSRWGSMKGL